MERAERGESDVPEIGVGELFGLLFGGGADRQLKLRRLMAEQFSDMDVSTAYKTYTTATLVEGVVAFAVVGVLSIFL